MEVISPNSFGPEDLDWTITRLEALARTGRADEVVRALKLAASSQPPRRAEEPQLKRRRQGRQVGDEA